MYLYYSHCSRAEVSGAHLSVAEQCLEDGPGVIGALEQRRLGYLRPRRRNDHEKLQKDGRHQEQGQKGQETGKGGGGGGGTCTEKDGQSRAEWKGRFVPSLIITGTQPAVAAAAVERWGGVAGRGHRCAIVYGNLRVRQCSDGSSGDAYSPRYTPLLTHWRLQ